MKLPRKLKSTPMMLIYLSVLVVLGLFQAGQIVFNLIGFIGGVGMTKKELIESLGQFEDDQVIVIADESGGWDNIQEVKIMNGLPTIVFGGGSPFSDE